MLLCSMSMLWRRAAASYSYKRLIEALCSMSARSKRFPQKPRKTHCVSPLLSEGLVKERNQKRDWLTQGRGCGRGALKWNASRRFTFVLKTALDRDRSRFAKYDCPPRRLFYTYTVLGMKKERGGSGSLGHMICYNIELSWGLLTIIEYCIFLWNISMLSMAPSGWQFNRLYKSPQQLPKYGLKRDSLKRKICIDYLNAYTCTAISKNRSNM